MIKYLPLLFLIIFLSCRDNDMTFEIGDKYVDVNTNLKFVDTLSVNSYTVKLDSLRTSGYKVILAGKYSDPEIGELWARSYFRFGLPNPNTLPKKAVYDSIQLILGYNKYYHGDTTQSYKINVHRLNQVMNAEEDGYLYNTSSFKYDPEIFGSTTFIPEISSHDSIKINLDPAFGRELFDLTMEKEDQVTHLDNFLIFLKGLMVNFDDADDLILGFSASDTLPILRLYYHYFEYDLKHEHLDYKMINPELQFNETGINNPVIDLPHHQIQKLPAKLTNNTSYVHSGIGIVTRLEIPGLRNMLELYDNIVVLRAELVLEPLRNSYRKIPLPDSISLYYSDRRNRFVSPIKDKSSMTQVASLAIDHIFQVDTRYTIEITDFINDKLKEQSDDTPALLVTVTPSRLYRSFDRLLLGSQLHSENDIELKLYYMDYEDYE